VDLPVLNDGNYYLHDDLQRFEHFKQSMWDYTDNYHQVMLQIRTAYVRTYDMDTVQTIIDEVENMEGTERLAMMRNMIHLNQVPPMIVANMDDFDKYQRLLIAIKK
jgi:hypothetical protein